MIVPNRLFVTAVVLFVYPTFTLLAWFNAYVSLPS